MRYEKGLLNSRIVKKYGIFIFLSFWLGAIAALAQKESPYLILVSFDGFRSDYLERLELPNFNAFIKRGVRAEALVPCFPSLTFPNHYSIVTGLHPGHHGLVANAFYDSMTNTNFSMYTDEKFNPVFYGGLPIWKLAKDNGIKTASFFWPGSDIADASARPQYYKPYDGAITYTQRIDSVLKWLHLPEAERPHFITLYFSTPDHESHAHGPWANETQQAVLKADSLLGLLMKGVRATGLPINVLLTSDHGMSEVPVSEENSVFVNELLGKHPSIKTVMSGPMAHVYVSSKQQEDSLYHILQKKETNFKVYRKSELPNAWNYQHYRVGDILIVANKGSYVRGSKEQFLKNTKLGTVRGEHGYDPDTVPEMRGIFLASGPNIKSGVKLSALKNIDIYPLMVKILGLPLPKIDGNPKTLEKIYQK